MKLSYKIIFFSLLTGLLFQLPLTNSINAQSKIPVIIDADTGNEVDDLYAIVRCLIDPKFEVLGLSSCHWQYSHWATPNTLEDSHRLNVLLLSYLNKSDIPHPRGAHFRLYDWGQDIAQHSAAAYHIIDQAHKMPAGEKLTVITLGATTNIASALLIDPAIVDKIKVYLLGTTYNFETGIWKKADFNCINDIHAINVLLDTRGLELHIMAANVAAALQFDFKELQQKFSGKHPLLEFLYQRWFNHIDSGRYARVIWDLSVIEALLHPEYATEITVRTPPENIDRNINVYSSIDAEKMREDFYRVFLDYFRDVID